MNEILFAEADEARRICGACQQCMALKFQGGRITIGIDEVGIKGGVGRSLVDSGVVTQPAANAAERLTLMLITEDRSRCMVWYGYVWVRVWYGYVWVCVGMCGYGYVWMWYWYWLMLVMEWRMASVKCKAGMSMNAQHPRIQQKKAPTNEQTDDPHSSRGIITFPNGSSRCCQVPALPM